MPFSHGSRNGSELHGNAPHPSIFVNVGLAWQLLRDGDLLMYVQNSQILPIDVLCMRMSTRQWSADVLNTCKKQSALRL